MGLSTTLVGLVLQGSTVGLFHDRSTQWVLVYIVVYQQFENIVLSPRITARTMSLHPAVAFGAVIAGGAIMGPIGALLALPAAASVQSLVSIYAHRYEVVASPLTEQSPHPGEAASPLSAADSSAEQGLASRSEEPPR